MQICCHLGWLHVHLWLFIHHHSMSLGPEVPQDLGWFWLTPSACGICCRSCDVDQCADLASSPFSKAQILMKANSLLSNPSLDAAHPVWVLKLPAYIDSDVAWIKRV